MRILVLGAAGMLGTDLVEALKARGHETVAIDLPDLDITDPIAVAEIAAGKFGDLDWCINCAAYTAVDKSESEADVAMLVNGIAPGYIAQACAMKGIKLIHISTDFVFDGRSTIPYKEDAPTNPMGSYGRSKLAGESASLVNGGLVVRTAWLYGPNGGSFPRTMIRAWKAGKQLRVVSDQVGTPTYTADLARVLCDIIDLNPLPGIYHAAGPDIVNWHKLAIQAINAYRQAVKSDQPVEVEPILTTDWPTPAARPMYSALSFSKLAALGVQPMRPLSEALVEYVKRLGEA
jgi:dTDP-4-dehydrorhamnose reductase